MTDDALTPTAGIAIGAALVVLGIVAYVLSDFASITALIPAFFGVAIGALGIVGRQFDRGRLATYGIGLLAVLAILGSVRGLPDLFALLAGDPVDGVVAPISQGLMVLFGAGLLVAVGRDLGAD